MGFVKNQVAVHIIEVVADFALNLIAVDVMIIEVAVDYVLNQNLLAVVFAAAVVGVIIQDYSLVALLVKLFLLGSLEQHLEQSQQQSEPANTTKISIRIISTTFQTIRILIIITIRKAIRTTRKKWKTTIIQKTFTTRTFIF